MSKEELTSKISDWLSREGYPLEFRTARLFRDSGFSVHQGDFVQDSTSGKIREIDVVAKVQFNVGEHLLRISNVVECKWSADKPWVMFTSSRSIAPSACIAQTICSELGSVLMWCAAGEKRLYSAAAFNSPLSPAFGGRQAFSSGNDMVFSTLQSVSAAARSYADRHDHPKSPSAKLSRVAEIVFPVIVIQGLLFEASIDAETK